MKTYAYRIYKNSPSDPIIGGTISGKNMEDTAQKIISQNNVEVIHETRHGYDYHYFMFRGSKVGILIYINPEEF